VVNDDTHISLTEKEINMKRLSVTDLPRDVYNLLRTFRTPLVSTYNIARNDERRKELLIEMLELVLHELKGGEKAKELAEAEALMIRKEAEAAEKEAKEREEILALAKEHKIDLDERKNNRNLRAELDKKMA
jgi:hypothetical protein